MRDLEKQRERTRKGVDVDKAEEVLHPTEILRDTVKKWGKTALRALSSPLSVHEPRSVELNR
jgi:hypothetical protein